MPPECSVICSQAANRFSDFYGRLMERDVSVVELHTIKNKEKLVKQLCEALATGSDQVSHRVVVSTLEERLSEYETFSSRLRGYKNIRGWICSTENSSIAGEHRAYI